MHISLESPKKTRQLSPFFTFFIMTGVQIGVGILGFERIITKEAGHDAWISVVITGLAVHLLIWMTYQILNTHQADLVTFHIELFGTVIGSFFNVTFLIYLLLLALTVLRTFVELIQVWMFPDVHQWVLAMLILTVAYAYVTKGLRVIVGLSVISLIITFPLLLASLFSLPDTHPENLLPIAVHTLPDILNGTKAMTLNILGFCVLFMIYPFIKNAPDSQKWTHIGVATNMTIYLLAILLTLMYFSEKQLKLNYWATITLWKVVDLSVIERFEYVGVSIWLFVALPSICLLIWSASRLLKRMSQWKQRTWLRCTCLLLFICSLPVVGRDGVEALNDVTSNIGFYMVYAYIPFLYLSTLIQRLIKKRGSSH